MASAKTNNGQLPPGFVSPFKRIEQEGTHDCLLACAAILCNATLANVKKMAVTLGMRANGPFYLDEVLFRKIVFNLSNLAVSDYKDLLSIDALPDVAVLCVDWLEHEGTSRHVVWHHVRATESRQAFSYCIDPAQYIQPTQRVTTDLTHLNLNKKPNWYLEITPRVGTTPPRGK